MIITNFRINFGSCDIAGEQIHGATIGHGPQQYRRFYLSGSRSVGHYIEGSYWNLCLGDQDENGTWRILKSHSNRIALILSGRPSDADTKQYKGKPSCGRIIAPADQPLSLLDFSRSLHTNGARWNEVLLDVCPGDIFAIDVLGDRPYRSFYLIDRRGFLKAKRSEVNEAYRTLRHKLKLKPLHEDGEILAHPWCNVLKPSETFSFRN